MLDVWKNMWINTHTGAQTHKHTCVSNKCTQKTFACNALACAVRTTFIHKRVHSPSIRIRCMELNEWTNERMNEWTPRSRVPTRASACALHVHILRSLFVLYTNISRFAHLPSLPSPSCKNLPGLKRTNRFTGLREHVSHTTYKQAHKRSKLWCLRAQLFRRPLQRADSGGVLRARALAHTAYRTACSWCSRTAV